MAFGWIGSSFDARQPHPTTILGPHTSEFVSPICTSSLTSSSWVWPAVGDSFHSPMRSTYAPRWMLRGCQHWSMAMCRLTGLPLRLLRSEDRLYRLDRRAITDMRKGDFLLLSDTAHQTLYSYGTISLRGRLFSVLDLSMSLPGRATRDRVVRVRSIRDLANGNCS